LGREIFLGDQRSAAYYKTSLLWGICNILHLLHFIPFALQAKNLTRDEVIFMDIGANVGWFTVNAAAMGYTVFAFEPTSPNVFAIRHTLCGVPLLQNQVNLIHKVGRA
jgi:hypothetical protein